MAIDERFDGDARRANLHSCTNRRIKHPCRYDNRRARFSFNDDNIRPAALLTIEAADRSPVERVPSVVNLYFLPDMGRMTPRLPWGAAIFSSPATAAAQKPGRSW